MKRKFEIGQIGHFSMEATKTKQMTYCDYSSQAVHTCQKMYLLVNTNLKPSLE
ncbi:MAG: hypothetical protein R2822_00110 [Spirosomataceae bacterium]